MSEQDLTPPLGPDLSPKQMRQIRQQKIVDAKDRSLEIAFDAQAAEFERRLADGTLAQDLKTMKTSSLLGSLTRMAAAIKQAAVVVVGSGGLPQRDVTALRAQSAVQLSDHERRERRRLAEAADAEVLPEAP